VWKATRRVDGVEDDARTRRKILISAQVLRKWGCAHECCATPFNATLDSYGSPFLDTDGVFGSAGSFFAFEPVVCLCGNQPVSRADNVASMAWGA
jgi:hypothetical protein